MYADPLDKLRAEKAYLFRHAILRDAAYALQPPSERGVLHEMAIEVLQDTALPGQREVLAAELAGHARAAQQDARPDQITRLENREREFLQVAAAWAARREDSAELVDLLLRQAELARDALKPRMDLLARAGGLCMGISDLARAERIARRMLDESRAVGDELQQARALRALMAVEATLGRAADAEMHIGQSLEILRRHNDRRELGVTLLALALQHMTRGQFDQSRQRLDQAIAHRDAGPDIEAKVYSTLADLELASGHYTQALVASRRAAELRGALADAAGERAARQNEARALLKLGRLSEAEQLAAQLAEEMRAAGRPAGEASMRVVLAEIESARGNHEGAVRMHQQVLAMRASEGSVWHKLDAHMSLAEALCAVGRFDEAEPHAAEGERLSREQASVSSLARALYIQGWVLQGQGRLVQAEAALVAALETQSQTTGDRRRDEIAQRLAEVRQAQRDN